MNNSFMHALVEHGFDVNLIVQLSHPPFLGETVEFAIKDRASRLKRRFNGTRHHAWLDALSRAMGFPDWHALSEATAALRNKALPKDGHYDPKLIPAEFEGTLVLVVEPSPEARPPEVLIQWLYAFSKQLALHSGQQRTELLECFASWWGAPSWAEFAARDPALAKKSFYEFEVSEEPDIMFEDEDDASPVDLPLSDEDDDVVPSTIEGQWRLSSACSQVLEKVKKHSDQVLRRPGARNLDLAPFLLEMFNGRDGEQRVLHAGAALGEFLLEARKPAEALSVLKEFDQRCTALMPEGFNGTIHYLIPENAWYLEGRFMLMLAHVESGDLASALQVAERNTVLDSSSDWWNPIWLSMLQLMGGNSGEAMQTIARKFDLDDCTLPDAYLAFIVAALVHGDYEDAAYRFVGLSQRQPDDVGGFLAFFPSDDPDEDPEEDPDPQYAHGEVQRYLLNAVLPAHPKVRDVLMAWDQVFTERNDDPTLALHRKLESAHAGTGERYDLIMRIEKTNTTEAERWRVQLAEVARTIMSGV